MESQYHGLVFEDIILSKITGMSKSKYETMLDGKYTSSMDIVKGIHSDLNYSIKVSKCGKTIDCGDILRFYDYTKEGFNMIVGCWNQKSPTIKNYDYIYEFQITEEQSSLFWNNIPKEALKEFVTYVKNIPYGKQAQLENRNIWKTKRQELYNLYGKGIVNIAAKIDSKSQRRVQCNILISDLLKSKINFTRHDVEYRGLVLPYEQESRPRQFKKSGSVLY